MIFVMGSFIVDLVSTTNKFPLPGETVKGNSFNIYPGGKGANQAVQIKRLNGDIVLCGCMGKDSFGDMMFEAIKKEGIDTKYIKRDGFNGISNIIVTKEGQNSIVMNPGANLNYTVSDLHKLDSIIDKANVCLLQLEMNIDVTLELIKKAKAKKKILILNPAPGMRLDSSILNGIDYLTPNETELSILTNISVTHFSDAIRGSEILLNQGVKNVIVTMGKQGSILVNKQNTLIFKSMDVNCVDSVGAGDAFNGGLAYGLDIGLPITQALEIATICGGLSVTKYGAIPSLPYYDEVKKYINKEV